VETSQNLDEVTPRQRQVGQKNVHIGPPLPPSPSPGGGGTGGGSGVPGPGVMGELIEFHNPTDAVRLASLIFDFRGLPPALQVTLRFTKLDTVKPLGQSISGVAKDEEEDEDFLDEVKETFEHLEHLFDFHHDEEPDMDDNTFRIAPSGLVQVTGVRLPAFGFGAALIDIRNTGTLEEGSEFVFQVQQTIDQKVVGGSMYVVRIAGQKKLREPFFAPSVRFDLTAEESHRLEAEAEQLRYLPPWAKKIVDEREKQQGKS
jgi:hypothetical protein